jgi:hypothetical protein
VSRVANEQFEEEGKEEEPREGVTGNNNNDVDQTVRVVVEEAKWRRARRVMDSRPFSPRLDSCTDHVLWTSSCDH